MPFRRFWRKACKRRVAGAEVLRSPGFCTSGVSEYLNPGHPSRYLHMNKKIILMVVFGILAFANDSPAQMKTEPPPDAFDLVFIQDSGPVLIRIKVSNGDQSVQTLFQAHL